MAKLVRDLMRTGVLTCPPELTLGQVAVQLHKHHRHALFVADKEGKISGVITDFDLLAGEWLSADRQSLAVMRKMTAGELMSTPVDAIDAGTPASEAARRMREETIRRLLVTEKGQPVGVISVSDFIANLAKEAPFGRKTVGDVMSDVYMCCRDKTPVISAARAMADTGWRSVLVVNAQGKPMGLFSGLDLLVLCADEGCDDIVVSEVMHPLMSIAMSASLREAADMMIENHHHRLVVIDPKQPDSMPLGIISSFDIVAEMAHPESVWQKK
jgi:CBS domain-containing protein